MTYNEVIKLQRLHGAKEMQDMINSGVVWKMEGSMGRAAMDMLEMGACMLPKTVNYDYYGNRIPMRTELKAGTKGTWLNAKRYWDSCIS